MEHNMMIPPDLVETMIRDRKVRISITKESHWYFFHFYFAHYIKYATAEFQREMIGLTERASVANLFIVAFRGSGKSTIITTSYPIWAILGQPQKKFVLIFCQTRIQAKQHMMNLRRELEDNAVLKADLGPFQEETDEWGSSSLVFSNQGARITVASTEQSIRGLRHHQYRPDLIICDDVEDMASAKTREGRNKIYDWLKSEVIPAGDRHTKLVVIGNLLHEDSLLMRLAKDITEQRLAGEFRSYPLLDEAGTIAWPGKYPTMQDIEEERKKIGNDIAWKREYLLKIIPDEDQAIDPEGLVYYDELPRTKKPRKILIGVDLAISDKETADNTAIVIGYVYGYEEGFRMYILPKPINAKMNFPNTITTLTSLYKTQSKVVSTEIQVEDVGYQRAVIDQLKHNGIPAVGIKVSGDKRSRLISISSLIQFGKIRFPRTGAEDLIEQLIGFGVERHDDLVDAFTLVAHKAIELDGKVPYMGWFDPYSGKGEWTKLGDTSNDY